MKKGLLILVGVAVLTILGVVTYLWIQGNNEGNLKVALTVPERVQVGVPFEIEVAMNNQSNQELKDAQLTVHFPSDIVLISTSSNKTIENKNVGILTPGQLRKETLTAVAVSGENTVKSINANVSYLPGSFSSRFEQSARADVVIVESGMFTDLTTPTKVLNGEEFQMELVYRNISDKDFSNVELRLLMPSGFTMRSTSEPVTSAGLWRIGTVKKGDEGRITVKGSLTGQDDSVFEFRLTVRAGVGSGAYTISEKQAAVSLSRSPLSLNVSVSGATGQNGSIVAGDTLTYTLSYANSTDIALKDVIIRAKLIGEMFDTNTLNTNASFRSQDNTLTWNASRVSGLSSINPGGSGRVTFTVRSKTSQPITRLSSKNFTMKVTANIESPTVPRFVAGDKITGFAEIETKVRGQFALETKGYYRDDSGIANSGFPPRVGKATTYTLHWILKNTSTDVSQISMKAFLGQNVRFTGKSKSTTGVLPVYNERTQEISWTVDQLPATKGVLSPPAEAIFQVEIIPSSDQVNQYPVLIQETIATGTDTFTDAKLTVKSPSVTLNIPDDTSVNASDKAVRN